MAENETQPCCEEIHTYSAAGEESTKATGITGTRQFTLLVVREQIYGKTYF